MVCRSVTVVSLAKTAEPIEMLFWVWSRVHGSKEACVTCMDGGARWLNLVNKIEPPMCGGDAAFLSDYFDHLFHFNALHYLSLVEHKQRIGGYINLRFTFLLYKAVIVLRLRL